MLKRKWLILTISLPEWIDKDTNKQGAQISEDISALIAKQNELNADILQSNQNLDVPIEPKGFNLRYVNLLSEELGIRQRIVSLLPRLEQCRRVYVDACIKEHSKIETQIRTGLITLGFPQELNLNVYNPLWNKSKNAISEGRDTTSQNEYNKSNENAITWLEQEIVKARANI